MSAEMNPSAATAPRVMIVGAGPVGCVGALILARAGVPVMLVERNEVLPEDLRASTFHPPTLDMLADLGITPYLIENGLIADRYQYRDRTANIFAEFNLSTLEGEVKHPYRVQCEQFKLTRHIVDLLREIPNAEVRLGTKFTGYAQDGAAVTATLESGGKTEEVEVEYLIGCDGAGSKVREVMGVDFKGFTYPEQFLVVATEVDIEESLPGLAQVNYVSAAEDWCVILRVRGNWRILFPTDPDGDPELLKNDADIEARLQALAPRDAPYPVLHKSLYRVQQRVAAGWRDGRVLLAGDAAHLNNPLGGMGMNGGLHDIFNLMEKLGGVLNDTTDPAVLDQYDRQRRTVTNEFIQAQTIANKKRIEEQDDEARVGRIVELQEIAADPAGALAYLRKSNMIDALERAATID
ncbi:FAD-dependent monooxygenase [Alphaproteobacteria bacterium KMM 3653]|uniref:FAD-dependent monooxygenase n=1 Tax=Harenicola maris TaxID=2841044 RepID=A0AAP2CQ79_9RHOB|nr:FAD-dependent monooxygenase [Harenicola maris]